MHETDVASGVTGTGGTRRVSSGAVWEPVVGYSRAVAAGDFVFVSGCTSIDGAEFVHPDDAIAQTTQAIANVRAALEQLGAGLADVVRTRLFVTDMSRWQEYGRAHAAAFGPAMPATSMVAVAALVDPRMLVEVEAVAYRPGIGGPAPAPEMSVSVAAASSIAAAAPAEISAGVPAATSVAAGSAPPEMSVSASAASSIAADSAL
jgi:enamine deaminase RidA (YjgF/YER057c/UK114 family)